MKGSLIYRNEKSYIVVRAMSFRIRSYATLNQDMLEGTAVVQCKL